VLAGRVNSRGRISVESDIRLNNYVVDPKKMEVRKHIAFVAQDDSLQVTCTPREALRFSAKLRLARSTRESQLDKLTARMLTELGLTDCADTMVGGPLIKGISGGERKRTSVGVELVRSILFAMLNRMPLSHRLILILFCFFGSQVTKPSLVFLDEPTSGLDSFSAVQLCDVLKKVANAGASVLFTIHQPSSEIFAAFDRLILLSKGRVMYQGPVREVPLFFATRNHPVPSNYNPADWVMDVAQTVSSEQLQKDGFFLSDTRDIKEPFKPEVGKDPLGITNTRLSIRNGDLKWDDTPPGFLTQTKLQFFRELVNIKRDTGAIGARFGFTGVLSILIGTIFLHVGTTDPSQNLNLQRSVPALIRPSRASKFYR